MQSLKNNILVIILLLFLTNCTHVHRHKISMKLESKEITVIVYPTIFSIDRLNSPSYIPIESRVNAIGLAVDIHYK